MVLLLAGVALVAQRTAAESIPSVPFSELSGALGRHEVRELRVEQNAGRLVAVLAHPVKAQPGNRRVSVISATIPSGTLNLRDLERWGAAGAKVRVDPVGIEPQTLVQILSTLALFGLGVMLIVRLQRGSRRSRRFGAAPPDRRLTMADVGGAREAQADLRDVIAYLKRPARFAAMGAKCPTGVLLVGPPGTGKTLLARAVAGEAGVPVIVTSGSEFNEMYVGVGASRVRELVRQAKAKAPCIVFIDEFDSIGGRRGRPNRSTEEENTLNQLLVEMDGMAGSGGVVWIAATNREDMLDPAARRPGRFDRVVEVGLPTSADRLEILRVHAAGRPLAADVDLDRLAALTVQHSGADLANLLNEAAIVAVHEESTLISWTHIEQARDKILLGRLRAGLVIGDDERRLIAIHEAGHAIVGLVACPQDKLHKVTIEARGRSLGAAHFAPDADRFLLSRVYLEGVIAKALGGRAAELVFLGPENVTSGAGSDLLQATSVARRMVAEFGMSSEVGLVSADPSVHGGHTSAQLEAQVDTAIRALVRAQADRAESLVRQHRNAVEALADALLVHGSLTADEVHAIARRHDVPLSGDTTARELATA